MPRCPNCQYILVLLEHRRKYKCAKCSRLYSQKFIEDKEFREYNKRQRKSDKENLKSQRKQRAKLSDEERKLRATDYRLKHKTAYRIHSQNFYEENKDKILANKKIYRHNSKVKYNEWRKIYRAKDKERVRLLTRISFWRNKQKELALDMLENGLYEAYNFNLDNSLLTFLLSDLLYESRW